MTGIPLYFRAYTEGKTKFSGKRFREPEPNPNLILVLDTETKSDQYQDLVLGSCGIWSGKKLHEFYIFYNDALSKQEIKKIAHIALKHNCKLLAR